MERDYEKASKEFRAWLESDDFATRINNCFKQYQKENQSDEEDSTQVESSKKI